MSTKEEIRQLVVKLREAYDNDDDTELGSALEALEVALVRANDDEFTDTEEEAEDEPVPQSEPPEPNKPNDT